MGLTPEQIQALISPLSPARVRQVQGNSHLEAWDVRRWLIRVFGYGGWSVETLECALVSERSKWDEQNPLKGRHSVVYRVQARLLIKDDAGNVLAFFDDGATGNSQNQPSLGDAHDQALKTAMSQALKRCAVNLGTTFGLSLYSSGSTQDVVGRSIPHSFVADHPTSEEVRSGELDDQQQVMSETAETAPESLPSAGAGPATPSEPVVSPSGSPMEEEQVQPPTPSDEDMRAATRALVEGIRQRVIDVLQVPDKKHALADLTRIQLDAGKHKLMNEVTSSPKGEEMTVALLLDAALKTVSREKAKAS